MNSSQKFALEPDQKFLHEVYKNKVSSKEKPYKHLMFNHYHQKFWGKYNK